MVCLSCKNYGVIEKTQIDSIFVGRIGYAKRENNRNFPEYRILLNKLKLFLIKYENAVVLLAW